MKVPLEGIQPSERFLPNNPLAEAKTAGGFEAKVESIREAGDDQASQGGYVLEEELEEQENQPEVPLSKEDMAQAVDALNMDGADIPVDFEYTIKFNKYTEQVELIKVDNGDLVQAISPEDLIKLISELRYRSGMFYDSEV